MQVALDPPTILSRLFNASFEKSAKIPSYPLQSRTDECSCDELLILLQDKKEGLYLSVKPST